MVKLTIAILFLGATLISLGHCLSLNHLNEVLQSRFHVSENSRIQNSESRNSENQNSESRNSENQNSESRNSESSKFNGTIWALLVAGSNEYYNYRHQADICHAYHVLRSHGIPESKIIVMMSDDIAHNDQNPTPGIIINQPGGKDVYHGVPKDYTGDEVTPEMFLKVLEGDEELASRGRKVIRGSSKDHIFVFFADHGAPGLVAFPRSELTARELNKALVRMSKGNRYSKMAIYIEACESGSMFEGLLPSNIDIFATTAANDAESSYACYWDDERGTYLGDLYSVSWMEDSDLHKSLSTETLAQQFIKVRRETNTSHVMEYGDLSIATLPLSQFQGSKIRNENETDFIHGSIQHLSGNNNLEEGEINLEEMKINLEKMNLEKRMKDAIPSHDVPLVSLKRRAQLAQDPMKRERLIREYNYMSEGRRFLKNSMIDLASSLVGHVDTITGPSMLGDSLVSSKKRLTKHECYDKLRRTFDSHCFDLSTHPYALRFLYILVNVCESSHETEESLIQETILHHCTRHTKGHPFTRIH